MKSIEQLTDLSHNEDHITKITQDKIIHAKEILFSTPNNNRELFNILVAMNLINAALKRKEFKSKERDSLIHYRMLKSRISRLFHNIMDNRQRFDIDFYIDKEQRCAYIEIDNLQFSFHNIIIDKPLNVFINSPLNNPKPWKGVRLQKIAGELFDYTFDSK
ncbi:hypothetical protein [Chryseobacterium flavum]|uniref:hypothetical protein n=1 Tax=Chryseobacterium flavum TaxID=415851 RepID=UPI0028A6D082|nr:hypothetical protein [Chryseobacterium flavum]